MAKIDIIAASTQAYKSCWESRHYLVKLALAPFLIKVFCIVFATSFGGDNTVHFLLYMLPALFAEGWMLAHFTRYLVLGQTWPFRPTGDMEADMGVLRVRARGVLGGMIVYVLINMVLGLMTIFTQIYLMPYVPVSEDAMNTTVEIPAYVGIISVLGLAFMFWGFRLLWLYIPYALNSTAGPYLLRFRGLSASVHMIGIWLICLLPFLLVMRLLGGLIAEPIGHLFGTAAGYFVMTIIASAVDTAKVLVSTAGITYVIRQAFEEKR